MIKYSPPVDLILSVCSFVLSEEVEHPPQHDPPLFLGITISQDMKTNIDPAEDVLPVTVQEVQPATGAADPTFCTAITESVLCTSITFWFGFGFKQAKIGCDTSDPSHPGHNMFQLIPSGGHNQIK